MEAVLFFIAAIGALGGAIGVIAMRNPFYSVLALIVHLFSLAVLFLLLSSAFVAAAQVVVYAGAVMVMFLFVMMLVNIEKLYVEKMLNKQWLVGLAATAVLALLMIGALIRGFKTLPQQTVAISEQSNVQQIGLLLYGRTTGYYIFPFEIASILLLMAVVGAVVMAKPLLKRRSSFSCKALQLEEYPTKRRLVFALRPNS